MYCLKCGNEIPEGQFCPDCLSRMAAYPVKPGTAIQLPKRTEPPAFKKTVTRRKPTAEEQLKKYRLILRVQMGLLLVLAVLVGLLLMPRIREWLDRDKLKPGQNYSSVNDTQPPTEEETGWFWD